MSAWAALQAVLNGSIARFTADLARPEQVQARLLHALLEANRHTQFGEKYDFSSLSGPDQFRARVPLQSHDDFLPFIDNMASGISNCLCAEDVVLFEQTSGTTHSAKLIPYTESGLNAFRAALLPWLDDLLLSQPGIMRGRCYWSISPATRAARKTKGGLPIGMVNDALYFGTDAAQHIAALLAVPPAVSQILEMEAWRYWTLRFLLEAADLSLISVWSPTFLTALTEKLLQDEGSMLVNDIARGCISNPHAQRVQALFPAFRPNPARAAQIRSALRGPSVDTQMLWPNLDTVSCWADGGASRFLPELKALFPHAKFQAKGLLATEAAITLPLSSYEKPVLAIHSGFYEFATANGETRLCHELSDNEIYRVIVTTHSGLYRYDTGDLVKVCGWAAQTPLLEFVGRDGLVSDLCGEKLTEGFVLSQLQGIRGFAMLAPSLQGKPHYVLILDAALYTPSTASQAAQGLEQALCSNVQYDYARRLGQLGYVAMRCVDKPMARHIAHALKNGQKLGDIKPPTLHKDTGWEDFFRVA